MDDKNKSSSQDGIYEAGLSEFDKKSVIISNIMIILWLIAGIYAVYLFSAAAGIIYGIIIAVLFWLVYQESLSAQKLLLELPWLIHTLKQSGQAMLISKSTGGTILRIPFL